MIRARFWSLAGRFAVSVFVRFLSKNRYRIEVNIERLAAIVGADRQGLSFDDIDAAWFWREEHQRRVDARAKSILGSSGGSV